MSDPKPIGYYYENMALPSGPCRLTLQERFDICYIPEPNSGCWIWFGGEAYYGYGTITFDGKRCLAHRLSWEMHNGAIPEGMFVCHKCDNPACVNPNHLFLGSQVENMLDMKLKGRWDLKYKNTPRRRFSPLTKYDVKKIFYDKRSSTIIGEEYGVSGQTINRIRRGVSWGDYTKTLEAQDGR